MSSRIINEDVNVTAWYFTNNRQMTSYPKRIEWGGRCIAFADGMQLCVTKRGVATRIFYMQSASDDQSYRLQCTNAGNKWKLTTITNHA